VGGATTGREMPRQNGKGDEVEVVELWGLTQRGEAILHTAHELFTVAGAHQRMVACCLTGISRGSESRRSSTGSASSRDIAMGGPSYRTRTAGGGRGLDDISRLFVDEAQHARPEAVGVRHSDVAGEPEPADERDRYRGDCRKVGLVVECPSTRVES
jgi:hypothetical protein